MNDFTDFWSKNGWLVQYSHREGLVTQSIIVTPQSKPPYPISDRYKEWTVSDLESWLTQLDEATYITTVLAQPKSPALDLRVFPAADGNWHAAWPPMFQEPGQIYARVSCFSPHDRLRDWNWEEKLEASRLKNSQNQLALAARMIWRAVQRGH